jgi:hypothetical protein
MTGLFAVPMMRWSGWAVCRGELRRGEYGRRWSCQEETAVGIAARREQEAAIACHSTPRIDGWIGDGLAGGRVKCGGYQHADGGGTMRFGELRTWQAFVCLYSLPIFIMDRFCGTMYVWHHFFQEFFGARLARWRLTKRLFLWCSVRIVTVRWGVRRAPGAPVMPSRHVY